LGERFAVFTHSVDFPSMTMRPPTATVPILAPKPYILETPDGQEKLNDRLGTPGVYRIPEKCPEDVFALATIRTGYTEKPYSVR
jgi:hypothetical protein